ncbi:MAG: hypothetical protein KAJ07_10315 [Planctomycetes bacterium]|nr:hypothetical protein [Planctomycetota bacterium]
MSAYIVEDQTINQIVGYLSQLEGTSSKHWILRPLLELGYSQLRTDLDKQKELGEEMFKLNCDSINQRYGENQAEQFRPLDYAFKPATVPMAFGISELKFDVSIWQAVKSLSCYLYQSCEGDCIDNPLYKALDQVRMNICFNHFTNRPEYDAANWG